MSKSNFDVKKYYPGMKMSQDKRGITGSFQNFSSDSNIGSTSEGSSMNELKKKYYGNQKITGGPQKDNIGSAASDSEALFTEDAVENNLENKKANKNVDALIIEPDINEDNDNNTIVGKKTIITEGGEPRASQG